MGRSFELRGLKTGQFAHRHRRMSANRKKSMAARAALLIRGGLVLLAGGRSLVFA